MREEKIRIGLGAVAAERFSAECRALGAMSKTELITIAARETAMARCLAFGLRHHGLSTADHLRELRSKAEL